MHTILGTKIDMSQTYVEGVRTPLTKINVEKCIVTQVKHLEKDGYWAIQLGVGNKKTKGMTKPLLGHLLKNSLQKDTKTAPRYLREVRFDKEPQYKVGDIIKPADIFNSGDKVNVVGVSKGKGFAGGVKRWGFHGGSKTHGQSDGKRQDNGEGIKDS